MNSLIHSVAHSSVAHSLSRWFYRLLNIAGVQETRDAAEDSLETPDLKTQARGREYSGVQGPQAEGKAFAGGSIDAPEQEGDRLKLYSACLSKEDACERPLLLLEPACVLGADAGSVHSTGVLSEGLDRPDQRNSKQRFRQLTSALPVLPVAFAASATSGTSAHQQGPLTMKTPKETDGTIGKSVSLGIGN